MGTLKFENQKKLLKISCRLTCENKNVRCICIFLEIQKVKGNSDFISVFLSFSCNREQLSGSASRRSSEITSSRSEGSDSLDSRPKGPLTRRESMMFNLRSNLLQNVKLKSLAVERMAADSPEKLPYKSPRKQVDSLK